MIMKALVVKAAVVAATATTAGGVALAATTGALPGPLGAGRLSPSAGASHRPKPAAQPSDDADKRHPHGSPSPSFVGLCHAYAAGNKAEHGTSLQNPAFTALIRTAGGVDKVDAFCTAVLAARPSHGADDRSGPDIGGDLPGADGPPGTPADKVHPSRSASHPGDGPTDHRTGKPSTPPGR